MRTIAVLAALTATVVAQKAPSIPILEKQKFGVADFAASANVFIGLGEKEGIKLLESRVTLWGVKGISTNERIGWLCRVLFEPKSPTKDKPPKKVMSPGGVVLVGGAKKGSPAKPIRAPWFGAVSLPYKSMPLSRWPKYPVAVQDDGPFVLAEGLLLAGLPEDPKKYIAHCREHGRFRTTKFAIPNRKTAEAALDAMIGSERWKKIVWSYESKNNRYRISEKWTIDKIREQVRNTPQ